MNNEYDADLGVNGLINRTARHKYKFVQGSLEEIYFFVVTIVCSNYVRI